MATSYITWSVPVGKSFRLQFFADGTGGLTGDCLVYGFNGTLIRIHFNLLKSNQKTREFGRSLNIMSQQFLLNLGACV